MLNRLREAIFAASGAPTPGGRTPPGSGDWGPACFACCSGGGVRSEPDRGASRSPDTSAGRSGLSPATRVGGAGEGLGPTFTGGVPTRPGRGKERLISLPRYVPMKCLIPIATTTSRSRLSKRRRTLEGGPPPSASDAAFSSGLPDAAGLARLKRLIGPPFGGLRYHR